MNTSNSAINVFSAITKLSEITLIKSGKKNNQENVALLRNKAFEILLAKNNVVDTARDNSDVFCKLLSWEYDLANEHNLQDHAIEIDKNVSILKNVMCEEVLRGILVILLELKQLPKEEKNILELEENSKPFFKLFDNNDFKFEDASTNSGSSYGSKLVQVPEQLKESNSYSSISGVIEGKRNDEGYGSRNQTPTDFWDQIWNVEIRKVKKWECYSLFKSHIEKPFFIELSSKVYAKLLNDLNSVIGLKQVFSTLSIPESSITQSQFMKDVKNVLFGVVSNTFLINREGNLVLSNKITVENISKSTLEKYCQDILFCGNSYKYLSNLIEVDPYSGQHKYNGYIFLKFCESIKKYLYYYKITVISISEKKGIFYFYKYIRKFSMQLQTLASFKQNDENSHGVALLNFLYQKILVLDNKENLILYSILYTCLQIYFEKFLKLWILYGKINDPFNEFFIMSCPKYLNSRGRTYWTRSYLIKEDMVPDFLSGIEEEILNCGKSMNLLKLCSPNSSISKYLGNPRANIVRCCLTSQELENLEETVGIFYLDVLCATGPRFSIHDFIQTTLRKDVVINNLICMKRKVTIERFEAERILKQTIEVNKRRQKVIIFNNEKEKLEIKRKEIKETNKVNEQIINEKIEKVKQLEEKILRNESETIIKYYNTLFEEVERRDIVIKRQKEALKFHLEQNIVENIQTENLQKIRGNPEATKTSNNKTNEYNLDIINANIDCQSDIKNNFILNESSKIISLKNNNLNLCTNEDENKKNKELASDLTLTNTLNKNDNANTTLLISEDQNNKCTEITSDFRLTNHLNKHCKVMTEAQRNKQKMMDIEFGTAHLNSSNSAKPLKKSNHLTDAQKNKMKVMASEYYTHLKENVEVIKEQNSIEKDLNSRSKGENENINLENLSTLDELNENIIVPSITKITENDNADSEIMENIKTIGVGLENIKANQVDSDIMENKKESEDGTSVSTTSFKHSFNFSLKKNVAKDNLKLIVEDKYCKDISNNWTNYFIRQSLIASMRIQKDLLQNELLKCFIEDLKFLSHLESLRSFFFLLDGEFAKNITEEMFVKLYDSDLPRDLINVNTLQHLVGGAVNISSKLDKNSKFLSIKINNLPRCFDLSNVSVLDCLSLSYKVCWPLNILLPSEAIGKYDEVFKFLLKIHRMSWILKSIFMDLKILRKEVGKRESFLLLSYHFQCVHRCRHVMTHFIQTLQNYIIGEILQTSWATFEKSFKSDVEDLEQLYYLHTTYLKGIIFMCWLNQRSVTIRKVLDNIFLTIIKFYDYFRSRPWEFNNDCYVHPNFDKLIDIFNNFLNLVQFLFKAGHKVAKTGYQPELVRLVDMLDINEYYSNLNLKHSSTEKEQ